MILIVCVSEKGGIAFNGRRVSRDRVVTEDILKIAEGKRLLLTEYSKKLIGEGVVCEDPLALAESDDLVFIEDRSPAPYKEKIKKMIIYRWNRDYPDDLKLDIDPLSSGFKLDESIEFAGYSHEKITKEVWKKCHS